VCGLRDAGRRQTEKKAPKKSNTTMILLAVLFLAAVAVSALIDKVSNYLLIGYVALSLITFIAYALDKSAAQRGAWRASEGTLYFWVWLVGGRAR
jgi:hypothetical protein